MITNRNVPYVPAHQKNKRDKAANDIAAGLKVLLSEYSGRGISDADMRQRIVAFEQQIQRLKYSIKP